MTIDDDRLNEIAKRAESATDGPWTYNEYRYSRHVDSPDHKCVADIRASADGEFIAHARQDVPDLVAEVRRMKVRLERQSMLAMLAEQALSQCVVGCNAEEHYHELIEQAGIEYEEE